jgi:hypothetical protein
MDGRFVFLDGKLCCCLLGFEIEYFLFVASLLWLLPLPPLSSVLPEPEAGRQPSRPEALIAIFMRRRLI